MIAGALGIIFLGALAIPSEARPPLRPNGGERPMIVDARAFGVVGDGVADDGPSIARMVAAAQRATPVTLRFPGRRTYRVASAPNRYIFDLHGSNDLTLDGGGSIFEIAPNLRLIRLTDCSRVTVRRLKVDFRPLPFVDGIVERVDGQAGRIMVRVPREEWSRPIGGPTHEDGEQAYFGMLWGDGAYGSISRHCWIDQIEAGSEPGEVVVRPTPEFSEYPGLIPGRWKISLPVPGIAHRYGPGACVVVRDCRDVRMRDLEVWSAPWMAFEVITNDGALVFDRVHVRPKPGTGRLMSSWRDGFHVKGNRASLTWEGCILEGMNDDAFNISTHASRVSEVLPDGSVAVDQRYPLGYVRWRPGDLLVAVDPDSRKLRGSSRVSVVEEGKAPAPIQGEPAAPGVTVRLAVPITGMRAGDIVWSAEAANPHTALRRCRIRQSCRLQSPVTLEECDVIGLLWFYADPLEGPYPGPVTVRRCTLRRGRGNHENVVVCSGGSTTGAPDGTAPPRALHDFRFTENRIYGGFIVEGVERVTLRGNRFLEAGASVTLHDNVDLIDKDQRPSSARR